MKITFGISETFFVIFLLSILGCNSVQTTRAEPHNWSADQPSYNPAEIDIVPLTKFVHDNTAEVFILRVYVSLLDQFGSQIKSPGFFRFELYEKAQRSADPKGGRLVIWPDIDLTDAIINNSYWLDLLRAYEFELEFEPKANQSYILHATCICPEGKRLSADFSVKYAP